jgi:hypothetical protein
MTIRILCQGTGSNCLAGTIGPNRESSPVLLQFSLAFDLRVAPNGAKRGEVSQVIALPAPSQRPSGGIKFGLCYRNLEICSLNGVKLAPHNAYFFRAAATPSNLDAAERFESALCSNYLPTMKARISNHD